MAMLQELFNCCLIGSLMLRELICIWGHIHGWLRILCVASLLHFWILTTSWHRWAELWEKIMWAIRRSLWDASYQKGKQKLVPSRARGDNKQDRLQGLSVTGWSERIVIRTGNIIFLVIQGTQCVPNDLSLEGAQWHSGNLRCPYSVRGKASFSSVKCPKQTLTLTEQENKNNFCSGDKFKQIVLFWLGETITNWS